MRVIPYSGHLPRPPPQNTHPPPPSPNPTPTHPPTSPPACPARIHTHKNGYWNMASYKILFDLSPPKTSRRWRVQLNPGPFSNCCLTSSLSGPDVCTCRHEKAERGKVWKANHISQKRNAQTRCLLARRNGVFAVPPPPPT